MLSNREQQGFSRSNPHDPETKGVTLLFDVPPEVAEARRSAARTADRFEREADTFFSRVRNAYLDRAQAEPARIRVLDARHSIAELQVEIGLLLQGLT